MKKVLVWLEDNLETALASIFLFLMLVLGAVQIFCRYLPISPFVWTEELIRYLFVWLVFITIGYAVKTDEHIRITFLKVVLPMKVQYLLDIFSCLCFMAVAVFCMGESINIIEVMRSSGQMATTIPNFPLWLLYLAMPVSFVDILIRGTQTIIKTIIKMRAPGADAVPDKGEEGEA